MAETFLAILLLLLWCSPLPVLAKGYSPHVTADKERNMVRVGAFTPRSECTVTIKPSGPCAWTADGVGHFDGKNVSWCPAYPGNCDLRKYTEMNGMRTWSGCKRYAVGNKVGMCDVEGETFDHMEGVCKSVTEMENDPCLLFWGDGTANEILAATEQLEPIYTGSNYKMFVIEWKKVKWQFHISDGGSLFRMCRTAWDHSCGTPCCRAVPEGERLVCLITDDLYEKCQYQIRQEDEKLQRYPEDLDKTEPSGYLPVDLDTKDLQHHSEVHFSELDELVDSEISCQRPPLICGSRRYTDYKVSEREVWAPSTPADSPNGAFKCTPTDPQTTSVECHNFCLVKASGLCSGSESFGKFFKIGGGFSCHCDWVTKISTETIYTVGTSIYYGEHECTVGAACAAANNTMRRIGRRLHGVTEELKCKSTDGQVDCGIAECMFLVSAGNSSAVGRAGDQIKLSVGLRDRLRGYYLQVKLLCDTPVMAGLKTLKKQRNENHGSYRLFVPPEELCDCLGLRSLLLDDCRSLRSAIVAMGTSAVVEFLAILWCIVLIVWILSVVKKFLYRAGFLLDGRSVSNELLECRETGELRDEQVRIIKLYFEDAITKHMFCSLGWWTRRQQRALKKVCLSYYLYLIIEGYGKNDAWQRSCKIWKQAAAGNELKDEVLKDLVTSGSRKIGARSDQKTLNPASLSGVLVTLVYCFTLMRLVGGSCETGSVDVSSSVCTMASEDTMSCSVKTTILSTIDVVGKSTCFNLQNKTTGDIVGQVEVEYSMLERAWSLNNLYYTGHWSLMTREDSSCYNKGWCTSKCDGKMKPAGYRNQLCVNGICKVQPVSSACCYWYVTIFTCGSSYKCGGVTSMIRTETDGNHGWVKGVGRGEALTTVAVSVRTNGGDLKESDGVIKGVGTHKSGPITVRVKGVANLPQINFGGHKIYATDTATYLTLASDINNPVVGTIGDVQASSAGAWTNPPEAITGEEHLEHFRTADVVDLSCSSWDMSILQSEPGINLLHDQFSDTQLPVVFQGSAFKEVSNERLIEELTGSRPLSVEIAISGTFAVKHVIKECKPEMEFVEMKGCFSCYNPGAILTVRTRSNNPYSCVAALTTNSEHFNCPGSLEFEPGDFVERKVSCISSEEENDIVLTAQTRTKVSVEVTGTLLADRLLAANELEGAEPDESSSVLNPLGLSDLNITLISIGSVTTFVVIFILLACFCGPFRDCLVFACPCLRSLSRKLPDKLSGFKDKIDRSAEKAKVSGIKAKSEKEWGEAKKAQDNHDKVVRMRKKFGQA
ncbi:putative glycoprotein [Beihai shrimp virus 3]|uniref:putative glycoprotein n=1 Tax=Beihai shrimp virus 3 TaxID=1922669 RepID=UPI00090C2A2F|nr:putative glycoprotein [Beihai shrimp virus 3]APG79221.1 putative glycoprotein [Beihai shrimp virus 3]APG79240.1 putative glycoprotein [Beihai shrimp virus 3]